MKDDLVKKTLQAEIDVRDVGIARLKNQREAYTTNIAARIAVNNFEAVRTGERLGQNMRDGASISDIDAKTATLKAERRGYVDALATLDKPAPVQAPFVQTVRYADLFNAPYGYQSEAYIDFVEKWYYRPMPQYTPPKAPKYSFKKGEKYRHRVERTVFTVTADTITDDDFKCVPTNDPLENWNYARNLLPAGDFQIGDKVVRQAPFESPMNGKTGTVKRVNGAFSIDVKWDDSAAGEYGWDIDKFQYA